MIYTRTVKAKETDEIIKLLLILSIIIAVMLIVINKISTPNMPQAAIVHSGIIYIWITVIYSIRKRNIGGHVLVHAIGASIFTIFIDYKLGYNGWSLSIAIPIIIIVANITMLVITIVSYKNYMKYVIFQLIIILISIIPVIFFREYFLENIYLSLIAIFISLFNLNISLILAYKDIKEEIIRKIHM